MKERVCSKSSSEVCTCWDIVTFSTRKPSSNLHELLNGFHHLWIQSTNFLPSGPAVPSDRLPLIWEKSGQGGAHATSTNVSFWHCVLRASMTPAGSVVSASPFCTTSGCRDFTTCWHAGSSSQAHDSTGRTPMSSRDWCAEEIPSKKLSRATGLRWAGALVPVPELLGLGPKPNLVGFGAGCTVSGCGRGFGANCCALSWSS